MADSQWSAHYWECEFCSLSGSFKELHMRVGKSSENNSALKSTTKPFSRPGWFIVKKPTTSSVIHPPRWQSFECTDVACQIHGEMMDEKAKPCQTCHLKMPLNVRLRAATGQYWRPVPTSTANKKGHYILLILTECRWTPLVAGLTKAFWHDFGNDCGHFPFQLFLMSWIFSFRYILCACFLMNLFFFSCLGILRL